MKAAIAKVAAIVTPTIVQVLTLVNLHAMQTRMLLMTLAAIVKEMETVLLATAKAANVYPPAEGLPTWLKTAIVKAMEIVSQGTVLMIILASPLVMQTRAHPTTLAAIVSL
jgi:hypothetical protein